MATKTATKTKPKTKLAKALPDLAVQAPAPPLSEGVPSTSGSETWANLPIDSLHRCPFNTRQHFDPEDIAGLGESIRADRLKEPLLVRPVGKTKAPTWDGQKWHGVDHWQVSDGERRLRALLWIRERYPDEDAKVAKVPVIVRPMTNEQVRAVMLVSREQSRDLVVSELVKGYAELRASLPGDAALAALVGKPVAYVRSILRLAKLPAWALAAVDAGVLPRATAELVARVPGEEGRKRAAACALLGYIDPKLIRTEDWAGFEGYEVLSGAWMGDQQLSYRDTKDLIRNHFQVELKGAPFGRKELYILPGCEPGHERSIQSCDECPKLAGNDPEAQAEGTRADVCLDPDCYREKVQAYREKEIAKAAAKGIEEADLPVTSYPGLPPRGWCDVSKIGADTELSGEFSAYSKHRGEKLKDLLNVPGNSGMTPFYIAFGPGGKAVTLVKTADARKALRAVGVLPKPEKQPRQSQAERSAAATTRASGTAPKKTGPSPWEVSTEAAEIAAKVLREYTTEQCSALDEHEEWPIRGALELVCRAVCYEWSRSREGEQLLREWVVPDGDFDKGLDAAICTMKPSQVIGLLTAVVAWWETNDGPNRPTGESLLAFAELDWSILQEQARRVLAGGESADDKVAKAETSPPEVTENAAAAPAGPVSETSAETSPAAVVLLAEIDNFPDVVFDACFHAGITSLPTLLERMAVEQPALGQMPLRNRVVAFLTAKLSVKIKPAEKAADAVATKCGETTDEQAEEESVKEAKAAPVALVATPQTHASELLAAIPGFPEAAANHLLDKDIFTLADLDAERDAIRKIPSRQNADRYEAMKELGVPYSAVYKAGDAIVEWEKVKDAKIAESETKPAKGKSKKGGAK